MTRQGLRKKLGITNRTFNKVFNVPCNNEECSFSIIEKACLYYDCDFEDIYGKDDIQMGEYSIAKLKIRKKDYNNVFRFHEIFWNYIRLKELKNLNII